MPAGILLDTNVWRYLADADVYGPLLTSSHKSGVPIIVAPAAVYESLAIGDPAVRNRVIALMARARWKRLMPEAFHQCEEIRAEITRLRPEWLLSDPELQQWYMHRRDWTRPKHGFWSRLTQQTDKMAEWIRSPYLDEARVQSRNRREDLRALKQSEWGGEPFVDTSNLLGGRAGDHVPLWRVEAADTSWNHLRNQGDPYRDWLTPWLNGGRISRGAWNSFWFWELGEDAMPRHRIRSRIEWHQGFRTVSDGSPGDSQLSAYLVEAQFVATSDKVFADVIEECAVGLPFKIAAPVRLAAGNQGVEQLLQWFGDRANEIEKQTAGQQKKARSAA